MERTSVFFIYILMIVTFFIIFLKVKDTNATFESLEVFLIQVVTVFIYILIITNVLFNFFFLKILRLLFKLLKVQEYK